MSEFGEIKQRVELARQSAVTTTGDAVVYITNYYYREESKVDLVDSEDKLPCPYRGLFHFEPDDARFFYGREVFVGELVEAVKARNFVPVLGASGSGKSSVVFAGLVPQLQKEGHWRFTHFRPENDPFHGLAMALVPLYTPNLDETDQIAQARKLARYLDDGDVLLADVFARIRHNYPNDRLLLIGDQFEQLYTLCRDRAIRQHFLDCLLTCLSSDSTNRSSTAFVMTMRVDFLGNALSYSPFGDVLQNGDIKLRAMNHEEFSDAIVKPAETLGVTFAPGLVERILAVVEDEPGHLPLLEFALTELWRQRSGKQLTHEAYEAIGEVEGALARHADACYDKLSEENRERARRIFIQLVRPGEGTEDTRRLATKAELGEENWGLVKELADARLVVTNRNGEGRETVEVVHEALIRHWGKLPQWMEIDREFRVWQERLRVALSQWEEAQQDDGALLHGVALGEAETRLKKWQVNISAIEREFIRKSIEFRDRLRNLEERRGRRILWGLVAVIFTVSSLAVWADFQRRVANRREQTARSIELATASTASLNVDTTRSLLLAIQANLIQETPQATLALWNAFQNNYEKMQLVGHQDEVLYTEFDPRDDRRVLSVSSDRTARIWHLDNPGEPQVLEHPNTVSRGSFDPHDSNRVLTVSYDGIARVWNLDNPGQPLILKGHQKPINYGSFDPHDSNRVLTVSSDGTARIWILNHPESSILLKGHESDIWWGGFDPNNKNRVLTVSADKTAKVWNLDQPDTPMVTLKGHDDEIIYGSFDFQDSNRVLTVSNDKTVRVWDINNPEESIVLRHEDRINKAEFDPQNINRVLSVSADKTAKVWDLKNLENPIVLRGHEKEVTYGTFSPQDSSQVLTASIDGTVKIWDINQPANSKFSLYGHDNKITWAAFDLKKKSRILTASKDRTVRIWDTEPKASQKISSSEDTEELSSFHAVFDPRGENSILVVERNGSVREWKLDRSEEYPSLLFEIAPLNYGVFSLSDSIKIATHGLDKRIYLWSKKEGKIKSNLVDFYEEVEDIIFDYNNENRILILSGSKSIFYDLNKDENIELLELAEPLSSGAFHPRDKNLVLTLSHDGFLRIWDIHKPFEVARELSVSVQDETLWHFSIDPKNSDRILTMGDDNVARLWNLTTGQIVTELKGHQDTVVYGSFDPNNYNRALTVSRDGTVRIWDLRTPNAPLILKVHDSGIIYGAFDPQKSNRIVTIGEDGSLHVYTIGGQKLLDLAWDAVSRCLTEQEKSNYRISNINLSQYSKKFNFPELESNSLLNVKPYCLNLKK